MNQDKSSSTINMSELLRRELLEESVVLGFYGGGNFGDELLLETLLQVAKAEKVQRLSYLYLDKNLFPTYHAPTAYKQVGRLGSVVAILRSKTVIVGGGGLWGMDVNRNTFFLSSLLLFSRRVLFKKVYLVGVGYYNSTTRLGRLSAWIASRAANQIIARDQQSAVNFRKHSAYVLESEDIALASAGMLVEPGRPTAFPKLEKKTVLIVYRRIKITNSFSESTERLIAENHAYDFILALMEPFKNDPVNTKAMNRLRAGYDNVIGVIDMSANPLDLLSYFSENRRKLLLIAPQYHAIVGAYITGVRYLPLGYDFKSSELFRQLGIKEPFELSKVDYPVMQKFLQQGLPS